jgi:hypothetical protein
MRSLGLAAVFLFLPLGFAAGQSFRATPQVTWVSHDELNKSLEHGGFGFGAAAGLTHGKWGVDLEGFRASLDPDAGAPTSVPFRLIQFDLRVSYTIEPAIAIQVGASRRWIDPKFAAPDVGFFRLGLLTQTALARQAKVWARGTYLIAPRFSGGGSAGLAIEIGLGTWIGTTDGQYGLRAEYDFQRIDRAVNQAPVPVQVMVAKVGFELGF